MTWPKIEFRRPQKMAAVLLLLFAVQCLWVVYHQTLTNRDYQFARCGRELWEEPSPLAGYLTTCGNLPDGTFAYRAAGLPLTVERIVAGYASVDSTWELRHLVTSVLLLVRLPFIFFGVWLGGALWWVTRRLYGNEGGFIALALYCFSPEMLRVCVRPDNEILAAWGVYGIVYTAIGLAHAMHGPPKKWRPRLVLLALALGLTAMAHIAAAILGLVFALGFMFYLAEGRRSQVLPVLAMASAGGFLILFASYTFNPDALSYIFESADARMWFSLDGSRHMMASLPSAGITIAAVASLAFYAIYRRSRYFGDTAPLLISLVLLVLATTGVSSELISSEPWIWALPFVLTFIGGVFADMLETPHRRLFLWLTGGLLTMQAAFSVLSLPLWVR